MQLFFSGGDGVAFRELCSWSATVTGFGIPNPLSLGGSVKINFPHHFMFPFVVAGMQEYLIQFSTDLMTTPIPGIVLDR